MAHQCSLCEKFIHTLGSVKLNILRVWEWGIWWECRFTNPGFIWHFHCVVTEDFTILGPHTSVCIPDPSLSTHLVFAYFVAPFQCFRWYLFHATQRGQTLLPSYYTLLTCYCRFTHCNWFNLWWPVLDPHLHLHWWTCYHCHLEERWGRDNSQCYPPQTKRLVDAVNGTYQTVLTIDPKVGLSDIVGTYTCTVKNVRGKSSQTVDILPGEIWSHVYTLLLFSVHIVHTTSYCSHLYCLQVD